MKKIILLCLSFLAFSTFAGDKALGKNVDVLFVIDNSGSMASIQQNLVSNAKIFFEQFAKQPYINWKIGIVSTDKSDMPYLGFDTSFDWSLIDYRDPTSFENAVTQFKQAVLNLGTSGDYIELIFYNVKRMLDLYDGQTLPRFQRPNSDLVVIMISDETEQSQKEFGIEFEASNFVKIMSHYKAEIKTVRFYGALSRIDLSRCTIPGDMEKYVGSSYETVINLTKGFNVSACTNDFGSELAKIGKDITSLVK